MTQRQLKKTTKTTFKIKKTENKSSEKKKIKNWLIKYKKYLQKFEKYQLKEQTNIFEKLDRLQNVLKTDVHCRNKEEI